MSRGSILKSISIISNLFLIHIALSGGLLFNYLSLLLLNTSNKTLSYNQVIHVYYIQVALCLLFLFGLIYLLIVTEFNGFLIFSNFSKYLNQEMTLCRKIFLTFIPLVILIALALFILNLFFFQSIYAPPLGLYHQVPANYRYNGGQTTEASSLRIILGSLKDRLSNLGSGIKSDEDDDNVIGRVKGVKTGVSKSQIYALNWDLIRLDEAVYYAFKARLVKFMALIIFNLVVYILLMMKFNLWGFTTNPGT